MSFLKIGRCIFFLCTLVACTKDKTLATRDFTTVFEKTAGLETATYAEIIDFYKQLAADYSTIAIYEMGDTDCGKPLHLVTFNPNRSFEPGFLTAQKQNVLSFSSLSLGSIIKIFLFSNKEFLSNSIKRIQVLAPHPVKTKS